MGYLQDCLSEAVVAVVEAEAEVVEVQMKLVEAEVAAVQMKLEEVEAAAVEEEARSLAAL